MFGIRLGPDPFRAPLPYPYAQIGLTGVVTPRDVSFLLSRGITRKALRHAVSFVMNEVALHCDHTSLTLPLVPCFSTCHDQRYVSV